MIRFIFAKCFWLVILFVNFICEIKSQSLHNTQLSLLTCDPGSELYQLFGHTALRIKNDSLQYDYVYNYGTFDFRTPGFAIKFMRGKLPYQLTAYPYKYFDEEYRDAERGVREQVLMISDSTKAMIIAFLENNAKPENRSYMYDFFYDNCSTRVRDVVEKNMGIGVNQYTSSEQVTLRNILHQYLTGSLWTRLGIDLIIGSKADIKATPSYQMFIPEKMHDILSKVQIGGKALLGKSETLIDYETQLEDRLKPSFISPMLINIVLILLTGWAWYTDRIKIINFLMKTWVIFAVFGFILILFLWFFTDHKATKLNYNILWLHPAYVFFLFKNFKYKKQLAIGLLLVGVVCMLNDWLRCMPQAMPTVQLSFYLVLLMAWIPIRKIKTMPT